MSDSTNKNKRHAGKEAITYIKQDTVIGLGSGSTVNLMLKELHTETQKGLNISGIPTSLKTEKLAHDLKIPLTNFENAAAIDLAIDGADLVDPNLNLIKGGGGSLLREKVVAAAAKRLIIIVDSSKTVAQFEHVTVPVEIVPFAQIPVAEQIKKMGAKPVLRKNGDTVFASDNHNYILDCEFPIIQDPARMHASLKALVGVVETGIFARMADAVIIADEDGIQIKP